MASTVHNVICKGLLLLLRKNLWPARLIMLSVILIITHKLETYVSLIYVSQSDILGPIDYFSDFEIFVSFERGMFADYSFKNKMKIFLFFMSISPLWKTCLKHQKQCICQFYFYQYICGQFHKIILQRYDIFTTYLKNFDMETLYPVFVCQ